MKMATRSVSYVLAPIRGKRSAVLLALSCFLLGLTGAAATTITVQDAGDGAANAANCPGASCRLRDALAAANAAGGDTIDFSVTGTITLTSGELLVDKSVTISGPGADMLAVDGNNASRVFYINPDTVVTI